MNGVTCCFQGCVGKNAELRHVKGGTLPMLSFSVAVAEGESETTWIRAVMFGEQAQQLQHRLIRGAHIYIEGRISLNHWTDQEGRQRSGLNVACWLVQPLGQIGKRKPRQPRAQNRQSSGTWIPHLETAPPSEEELNDRIPF